MKVRKKGVGKQHFCTVVNITEDDCVDQLQCKLAGKLKNGLQI